MNVARKAVLKGNVMSVIMKLLVACLLIVQVNAHAGFVLGRGVINSENGNTLWAEYNADGGYLILDDIVDNNAHTVAGLTLLAYQNQLNAYEARTPNSQYLTLSDFESIDITAKNGKPFNKPRIPEEAKIVVLPATENILTEHNEFIEYIWLPYDIKRMGGIESQGQGIKPAFSSYLISRAGEILHKSADEGSSIGPLNGYYYPKDEEGNLILEQREYENGALPFSSRTSDSLINPVPGVMISGYGNKKAISEADGWINASALTECPNSNLGSSLGARAASAAIQGIISSAPPITLGARLPFVGFSATEPKQRAYFAYGIIGMCDITTSNIFVSMQSVMGGALIFNPDAGIVPLTARTSFHLDTQRNEATYLSSIDFDGDDIKDPASYLKYDESANTYTPLNADQSSEATHMGIYFTTGVETDPTTNLAIPSIIRAVDRIPQYINKGLLKTINSVDLAQTDLYVFRVSSGQLITAHKGVEQGTFDDDYTQGGTFNNAFNFQFAMRGPDDYWAQFDPYPDYVGWASATKVTEPFQKRNADHVRPGEQLQLVAINRASGYIGSVKFTSKQVGVGGDINNALDSIIMRPPNLKIWAERVHEIQQGRHVAGNDEQTNLIGNEGITLEDDLAVSVHTEWLDYDGLPLPAELGDFGYTARIAKVTSTPTPDVDALRQNSTNEFAIKPGRNLSVLQFTRAELSRHHFYVQVNPYPKSQQNDFGSEIYNPLHKNYLPDGSGDDEHDLPDIDDTDLTGNTQAINNPLRYRPAHYVPFKVPLYDEGYSQIQQDVYDDLIEQGQADNTEKPDPLYRWYYRPELQFSQYNFDAKSLIVNQIDEDGTESTTDINIEDDGADFGPIFDDYTDSVELLFDLLGPELDRLPPLENDREFVLSLGGEEAIATIGADGKVTFENPDHLTQLNSEDLLSLRLYLNGDAGNVLWEYQMAGFSSFWSIYPNQQPEQIRNTVSVEEAVAYSLGLDIGNAIAEMANTIHLIPAANAEDPVIDAEDEQEYYLLGGMRVKLLFKPEVNSTLGKVDYMTWRTNKGKFYVDNNPSISALGDHRAIVNATHDEGITVETYFQPDDWITNFNGEITASVKYENSPVPKNYKFKLKTRVLQPKSPTPMQGADVAMLEGLLWQLGISPQKGAYGSQGARIASNRSGSGEVNTKNCQGTAADDRSKFYIGWSACAKGAVSLAGMVLQFQGRNDLAKNAKVGRDTLQALKRDYDSYREAAYEYNNSPILSQSHGDVSSWIDDALKVWQEGLGNRVPVTYTDDIHEKVLTQSGEANTTKSRKKLLTNWIAHESKYHWGSNNAKKSGAAYQPTPFRMNEGGDRYASLSFSQLRYEYRYGSKPCAAHKEAGLNLYSPKDNITSFVIHTSSDNKASSSTATCFGGMYKSFGDKAFLLKHRKTIIAGQDTNDLMGYRHGSGTIKPVSATSIEDEYEGLAKAIAAYNAGPSYIADRPWAGFLKYRKSGKVKNTSSYCHACRYSIEVRNGGSAVHGLGLTHRTYIWKGGTYPATLPTGLPHPKANQDWCFAYGEKEWVEGSVWKKIKAKAFDKTPDGEAQTPVGRITCQ